MTSMIKEDMQNKDSLTVENIVAIGCSTGGPRALHKLIPKIPRSINAAVLVVQHMPPGFTASVAEGLNKRSKVFVKEAANGEYLKNGTVYFAPGGCQMKINKKGSEYIIEISDKVSSRLHNPSINVLLESLVGKGFKKIAAVILTGMGSDGSRGILKIKEEKNSFVIVQDEKTSVVYGMPKAAIKTGKVDIVAPLDKIVDEILSFLGV